MSRHGDCAEIEILKRKIPDMPDIKDPFSFIDHVRNKGYSVSSQSLAIPSGKAYQVDVVELSLNLIFVQKIICKNHQALNADL